MPKFEIGSDHFSLEEILSLLKSKRQLVLSSEVKEAVLACRAYLDNKMSSSKESIYGINTGFGDLHDKKISHDDLSTLQSNLVMSHACGMGDEVPQKISKTMLLLKIIGLSKGKSAVQLETLQRLVDMYNEQVYPVVYQQGSLGASGDLAPLAHLALPLLGMGEVYYKGEKKDSKKVLKSLKWSPIVLQSKEGLALLNGTQFMSAYAVWIVGEGQEWWYKAHHVAATSIDALLGRKSPFHEALHYIRPHEGQQKSAALISQLLEGSQLQEQPKEHVQDPYSLRCTPQVMGASYSALDHAQSVLEIEINAVTDNPTVFPEEDLILSGGNFHGQHLALILDYVAIALSEMASISERRTYKLIGGLRGLPRFLVANPGLDSGMMIPQYTAASIVSQNKQLCTPASVDTIDSSNGQEDHVSMGANAATKGYRVLENMKNVISIEWMNAAQAMHFRRPNITGPLLEQHLADYSKKVKFIAHDEVLRDTMQAARTFWDKTEI